MEYVKCIICNLCKDCNEKYFTIYYKRSPIIKTVGKKLLSIVIPVYNEEENINKLLQEIINYINKNKKYRFEAIMVENGSTDTSFTLLTKYAKKDSRIKILQLSRNFTGEGGIAAGINFANGDAVIIMMADLQEPIEILDDFIKKWGEGYEIVYGVIKKRAAGIVRNFCSVLFYKIINKLTNNMFPENASDFRLIDKKVYLALNSMNEHNKYLRGLIAWTGFSQAGIPFDRKNRFAGKSKAHFLSVLDTALNGIFSFSYLPLRLVTFLGTIITIVSFLLFAYYLSLFIIYGRIVPGITTLILIMLLMFGLLFFVLGIISEYLLRIYNEVKQRPNFIVKNKINFD